MRKMYATSALFVLAVSAAVWAQPPAKTDPPGTKSGPAKVAEPPKKPTDPTDTAIAAALANDADMKMARAKLQLAEAELAKAKQAVTLRVLTLKAQIESLKVERDATLERVRITEARVRAGQEPQTSLAEVRITYEKVNRALATAEAEWTLLTGGADATAARDDRAQLLAYALQMQRAHDDAVAVQRGLAWLSRQEQATKPPVGAVSDRIRAALDKPLSLKVTIPVSEVADLLKQEGKFDVAIRGLDSVRAEIELQGDGLPVGAWLQLIQDQQGLTAYVREYGILFAKKENAPADAVTLVEFWKQKPAVAPAPAPKK
jgi:hypothetical protein